MACSYPLWEGQIIETINLNSSTFCKSITQVGQTCKYVQWGYVANASTYFKAAPFITRTKFSWSTDNLDIPPFHYSVPPASLPPPSPLLHPPPALPFPLLPFLLFLILFFFLVCVWPFYLVCFYDTHSVALNSWLSFCLILLFASDDRYKLPHLLIPVHPASWPTMLPRTPRMPLFPSYLLWVLFYTTQFYMFISPFTLGNNPPSLQ